MNHLYTLLISVLVLSTSISFAQNRSNSGNFPSDNYVEDEIPDNRMEVDKLTIDNTFKRLDASLRNKALATDNVFCETDIEAFLDRYNSHSEVEKDVDYESGYNRVYSTVKDAETKLSSIGNAQNVTLMGTQTFYGDELQLTKVIQHRIDVVNEKGEPLLYDVLFVEINGEYKILAVNTEDL